MRHRFFLVMVWLRYHARKIRSRMHRTTPLGLVGPFVINLPHRVDRLDAVRSQFAAIHRIPVVVPGVVEANGALGCALAHRNLLRSQVEISDAVLWIAEDDVEFHASEREISAVIADFLDDPGLDVLCLSHMTRRSGIPISSQLALSVTTETTACYLVKPWARAALEASFHSSVQLLSLGREPRIAAIDVVWKALQRSSLVFCIPRVSLAIQSPSFSDVLGREVDYFAQETGQLPPLGRSEH